MITGTKWVEQLPKCEPGLVSRTAYAQELLEREKMVLDAVRDGLADFNWCSVVITEAGHSVELLVLGDAMRVGSDGDWVRPNATHPNTQRIADMVGAILPTEKIADYAWQQSSLKLVPSTLPPDSRMASTARMLEHSRKVSSRIQAVGFSDGGALFGSVSKYWALTNEVTHLEQSANAGWHVIPNDRTMPSTKSRTPGGFHVLQPLAEAHVNPVQGQEANHVDYSQCVAYLVKDECWVDGSAWRTADLLVHPELAKIVSYEGPLHSLRHPAVMKAGAAPHPEALGLGSRGELVAEWQKYLQKRGYATVKVDGDFGPITQEATYLEQAQNNLPKTGRLDTATLALMGPKPAELHAPSTSPFADDVAKFPHTMNRIASRRLAKFYTPTTGRRIRGVCIHTAESFEAGTGAEAVAAFFADPKKPRNQLEKPIVWVPSKVSAHLCTDNNSTVQCVPFCDVAYAAPGANRDFIHIELSGYARQTVEEWDDDYSRAELTNVAEVVAAIVVDLALEGWAVSEVQFLADEELKDTSREGVTTHAMVTKAFHETDHTDPGPHFPVERFMQLVNDAVAVVRDEPLANG